MSLNACEGGVCGRGLAHASFRQLTARPPPQLIYDIFNTTAVQFLFYVLYVFLFQVLIFNLRSPDEYNMSKYVFVSRQH